MTIMIDMPTHLTAGIKITKLVIKKENKFVNKNISLLKSGWWPDNAYVLADLNDPKNSDFTNLD